MPSDTIHQDSPVLDGASRVSDKISGAASAAKTVVSDFGGQTATHIGNAREGLGLEPARLGLAIAFHGNCRKDY